MKDNFNQLFDKDLDIAEPTIGHFDRFEKRLSNVSSTKKNSSWKWISVAASIVLLFGVWLGQNLQSDRLELADVSPKMEETQTYFASVIKTEVQKINKQKTPENQKIIADAFLRMDNLETQYVKLTKELKESDADKRVIFAMISNFQQRIEILKNVLEQMDNLKQLKTIKNETYL
ncbi:MAG: hypothetical protein COB73_02115 [Flavobacteriaceae bacterium]|nr:MAG: hypothetical protein COB73_02115 [Flavobacteriaceae bacterium]